MSIYRKNLTQFLDAPGSYEGLDIVDVGIDWCQRTITPRFPRFRFHLADVFNRIRPYGFVLLYALILSNGFSYIVVPPARFLLSWLL